MGIKRVIEQTHLRTGGDNVLIPQWVSQRIFLVYTTNKHDDDGVVLYATDPTDGTTIPALLSPHPTRLFLFVSKRDCRWLDKAGLTCEITISYTVISGLAPWQEPAVISGGGQNETRIVDYDIVSGDALLNSASQPFDPGEQKNEYQPTLSIQKNLLNFDTSLPQQYCDSVNSNPFLGAEEGYCMCTDMPFTTATWIDPLNNRWQYFSVTFNFAFRNPQGDSWQSHILDAGLMQKSGSGKLIPIIIGGRETSTPVPLKNGVPLPPGADPVFLDFKKYPEQDFSSLQGLWS